MRRTKTILQENELIAHDEVAEYFRIVPRTLRNWRSRGVFRCNRVPGLRKIMYNTEDVIAFREEHTHEVGAKSDDRNKTD